MASFQCESNSLAKLHPKKHDFEYFSGEEIFKKLAVREIFEKQGYEVIPSVYAVALPSATVERTTCLRLDYPIGKEEYQIPIGQYALHIKSSVPVCACFGRLDVRQSNMAYYALSGYAF